MDPEPATAQVEDRTDRWTDTFLLLGPRVPGYLAGTLIVLGLLLCYALTYRLGGAASVAPGWFALVVLPAAARFRYRGAFLTAIAAAILAGPLMPLDVSAGTAQSPSVWIGRGLTFVVIGIVTAALVDRVQAARRRELDLARREVDLANEQRDLATRKAAVIATVSHEFRTPLTVISGVARTLEIHGMVSSEGSQLLTGLTGAAQRLTDLVTTVGAVMEHDDAFLRLEPIVMRELLDEIIDNLGVRDPHNRVTIMIDRHAELAVTDRQMLGQLLRHIIENAVKFSPDTEPVAISIEREERWLLVRVTDRGAGIEPGLLERTDPFVQGDGSTTRTSAGLGLGLFAASRLAEILGGKVELRPGLDGGTVADIRVEAPDPAPSRSASDRLSGLGAS